MCVRNSYVVICGTSWSQRQGCRNTRASILAREPVRTLLIYPRKVTRLNRYINMIWGGDAIFERSSTTEIFVRYGTVLIYLIKAVQETVSMSSTETEYMALSEASKVLTCLPKVLKELGVGQDAALIHQDNQACFYLAQGGAATQSLRQKHIDIRHIYIMEQVDRRDVELWKVETVRNLADISTSPMQLTPFRNALRMGAMFDEKELQAPV